ncbi:hypothetical protein N657DRAFT_151945 [Parathielavia appendiculata]|uniref:Uncharacterized protein n=1 Tax=Parathielavia appendiculata TaxID=2587402 RepID=A0AAN6TTX3_9PEZI|nr:hypothetical protein N657DRAFT_151945 [Parathielavia appendiculata]
MGGSVTLGISENLARTIFILSSTTSCLPITPSMHNVQSNIKTSSATPTMLHARDSQTPQHNPNTSQASVYKGGRWRAEGSVPTICRIMMSKDHTQIAAGLASRDPQAGLWEFSISSRVSYLPGLDAAQHLPFQSRSSQSSPYRLAP